MFAHLKPFPTPRAGVTSRIKGFNTPSSLITKLEKDNNIDPMCRGASNHTCIKGEAPGKCGGGFMSSRSVETQRARYEIRNNADCDDPGSFVC